jgi:Ricin-type beta-trefoil lectin domain
MVRLRSKMSAALAASLLAMGCAFATTMADAGPAYALPSYCDAPYVVHNGGDYLDDYGGGSGTYVHTYPQSFSGNQSWCLEAAREGGYYFHPLSNPGLCLDAHTYNSGQPIWVYSCNGTLAQRWCWNGTGYLVTAGNFNEALRDNGTYRIVSINNGGNNRWSANVPVPDTC